MILSKVRTHLSILLALCAAIFAGYAYITNLHYNILNERLKTVEAQNERQVETIRRLARQSVIDNQILELLTQQRDAIHSQGYKVRSKLEELARNDQEIRNLFDTRLPPASIRMLVEQAKGAGNSGGFNNPSGNSDSPLPSSPSKP